MGTRHRQAVITKNGDLKLSQYGQWDGYPEHQGKEILTFLLNANLEKYQEELENLREITKEEIEMVNDDDNWEENYPYMSRDCGSRIHQMITEGKVKFVSLISEEEADRHCAGFYTIDFQQNTFTTEFRDYKVTYNLDNLPSEEDYLDAYAKHIREYEN